MDFLKKMFSHLNEILVRIKNLEDASTRRHHALIEELILLNKSAMPKDNRHETCETSENTYSLFSELFQRMQIIENIQEKHQQNYYSLQDEVKDLQRRQEQILIKLEQQDRNRDNTGTDREPIRRREQFPMMGLPFQFLFESHRAHNPCNNTAFEDITKESVLEEPIEKSENLERDVSTNL